jgi:hypothetical protein
MTRQTTPERILRAAADLSGETLTGFTLSVAR